MKDMPVKVEMKQLPIRVPIDVKDWLAGQAAINGSSQNSEVIRAIRDRMAATETQGKPQ